MPIADYTHRTVKVEEPMSAVTTVIFYDQSSITAAVQIAVLRLKRLHRNLPQGVVIPEYLILQPYVFFETKHIDRTARVDDNVALVADDTLWTVII